MKKTKVKQKIKINLGCGILATKGFINVDKYYTLKQLKEKKGSFKNAVVEKGSKYIQGDMLNLPFPDNYADYVETIDAVEHIPYRSILTAFKEMYRVLKLGGMLRVVTPNFNQLAELWTKTITDLPLINQENFEKYRIITEIIYGNQTFAGEYHLTPFNPQFLVLLLTNAGFDVNKIMIVQYPMGSDSIRKKIKTQKWDKGAGVRSEMLLAEVIK
jgi:predicted SAM-dependent methyltransferase